MSRDHIKVPLDLRRRGSCRLAHSFDVSPLHLCHHDRGHHHFGNHCNTTKDKGRPLGFASRPFTGLNGGGACGPRTTVRWGEGDEGLCHTAVVCARQILTVGFLQEPQLDPQVLTNAVQRVPRQEEPFG